MQLHRFALAVTLLAANAPAQQSSAKTKTAQRAISAWLLEAENPKAKPRKLKAMFNKARKACAKLEIANAALRTLPPLSKAKAGTHHRQPFRSHDLTWEFSIRLPKGYDNKRRFPVLVLPDHETMSPRAAISQWQDGKDVDKLILFRPVITRHMKDKKRFPDQQFFAKDIRAAQVMADALRHLRLHYAIDHDRLSLTGLSQAGYYSWYHAATMPDEFAAVVPESSGGLGLRATAMRMAPNLKHLAIRILHSKGDKITPFADAKKMRDKIAKAGGKVEFISFSAKDYKRPNPRQHPIPGDQRIKNVLPFVLQAKRQLPSEFTRVVRFPHQSRCARFRLQTPNTPNPGFTVHCSSKDGKISCSMKNAVYLVPPETILDKKRLTVGKKKLRPKADIELLLRTFRACPDPQRLVAAEVEVK